MELKLTPEEKELLALANEAGSKGDWEKMRFYASKIPLTPASAMAAKKTFGPQFLLDGDFNLSWAEAEYGKDWLSR